VSGLAPRLALRLGLALGAWLAALPGCAPDAPAPHTRLADWAPQGSDAALDARVTADFTAPIATEGLSEGRHVALTRAGDARAALKALEAGEPPGLLAIAGDVALLDGGRRLLLTPRHPLPAGSALTLLVAPTLLDAEGRPVLDPEGHRRSWIGTFSTVAGPPPRPVLTEVRAVAATPQAGGEYVELFNLGDGPLDLSGWRLEKRTATGLLAGCTVAAATVPLQPGSYALLTSGAWDDRYPVPAGTVRFGCGAATLAGGLADDRPPELRLLDWTGALLATFGEGGTAPRCPAAVERIDLTEGDVASNLACAEAEGTPGRCNSVTPPGWCP
jgi:hypothetical protein